jgi:hypothetical protein
LSFERKGKITSKKRPNISSNSIFNFSFAKEPFKKKDVHQKHFLEDLGLLIIKFLKIICGE